MKKQKGIRLLLMALCVITGCSTARPVQQASSPPLTARGQETHFEVIYSIGGHGEHRLIGSSNPSGTSETEVASYDERELVDQALVRSESYDRFFTKLVAFAQKPQRVPSQEHDCRSPYSITLKFDGKTSTSKGCRLSDDGGFAKLVREGEFLIYSKNSPL